jgi:sugar phosphate isomerase/epimerase
VSVPAPSIYFGSILLEPRRWSRTPEPSYRVSDWLEHVRAAGFDGVELWEHHWSAAPPPERDALVSSRQVTVFNSYAALDAADRPRRAATTDAVNQLGARAVKFNLGRDVNQLTAEHAAAAAWAEQMPAGVQLWCECHGGTVLETPAAAAAALATWPEQRFGAIAHAFSGPRAEFTTWLAVLGPRLRHVHVQIRGTARRFGRLADQADEVRARLELLAAHRFDGSFTLEFAEGAAERDEDPAGVWAAACADLEFLRLHWPR